MDFIKLDQALIEIVKRRKELKTVDYSNPRYDELEEQLHDMEDEFLDTFGDPMEDILQDVHDEICPDSDVLLPIAYLAQDYKDLGGNKYDVGLDEGVFVETEAYDGKETKLVLVPGPTRLVLNIARKEQKVVWQAGV